MVQGTLLPRRTWLRARFVAVLLAAAPLVCAGSAFAQAPPSAADKETARTLMNQGDDRFEAKDYAGALKAYQGADALMHLPMTGAALARAQVALGLLLEARDTALQVAHQAPQAGENPKYAEARAEARALADALAARIPSLDVKLSASPPGLVVSVDDAPIPPAALGLPRKVNPGKHVVTARAPGFADARVEITVAERATLPVPVQLVEGTGTLPPGPTAGTPPVSAPPPVAPAGRTTSPLVYVGFGIGGASLLVGAITGGLSLSKTSKLVNDCPNMQCAPQSTGAGERSSALTLANVSNVTLGIGAAGVIVGVVGVVLSRGDRRPAAAWTIEPMIGPRAVGVTGVF
jgi:hypothetical protein